MSAAKYPALPTATSVALHKRCSPDNDTRVERRSNDGRPRRIGGQAAFAGRPQDPTNNATPGGMAQSGNLGSQGGHDMAMTLRLDTIQLRFLQDHHAAAMVTLRGDGSPHVAQVGVGLVDRPDGTRRLRSSGTRGRVRTRHLRRDPRCTLFVFDPPMCWLGLDTTVTILDGSDAPRAHLPLFRTILGLGSEQKIAWADIEVTDDELVAMMVAEQRLIYEFEIHRAYGMPER